MDEAAYKNFFLVMFSEILPNYDINTDIIKMEYVS
jgi:hypothetical protein